MSVAAIARDIAIMLKSMLLLLFPVSILVLVLSVRSCLRHSHTSNFGKSEFCEF